MICLRKIVTLGLVAGLALILAKAAPIMPIASPERPQQAQDQTPDARGVIRARSELVVVPVTVKDRAGSLVSDLRQNEFRVLDDGVEQRISLFSTDAFPLSAVVLVDGDFNPKTIEEVQKNLLAVAGAFSDSDEVALGRFGAFYSPMLDFTTDNDKLLTALKQFQFGDTLPGTASDPMPAGPNTTGQPAPMTPPVVQKPLGGQTTKHIDDAIHAAATLLRGRERERRKMIVIISDGINARNNTYSYNDTLKLLLTNDISVYVIGVDQAFYKRGKGLSRYAQATGGDVYKAPNASILSKLCAQASEQARHQYTIGYVPTQTDRSKDYHPIEVRVRRPQLSVLTRDGYYLSSRP